MFNSTAYINGKVYTMEREGAVCSAFAVRDGKFIYCGADDEARRMADETVDLRGAVVLPGLIDTHEHLYSYAGNFEKLMLGHVGSMEELKETLRKYAENVPAGEWIYGFGFDNEFFTGSKAMPTRYDLDEACPNNPVLLSRSCMHFFSANSLALKAAGIDRNFKPEVEGNVRFDAEGEPTGVVCDAAGARLASLVPDKLASLEAKKNVLEKAIHELNTHGLTGVHAIQGRHVDLMEYTNAYQELSLEGRLTARIYLGYDELPNCCIRTGLGDDMVKYGFYKLYADGNFGGYSAALLEPFSDRPDTCGQANYTQEEMTARIRAAYERNIQVAVHVIGDRAADMLTTAIETVYRENPKPDPRFRMIHMSVLNEDVIQRIKKLPVMVDIQPMFIHTDMPWIEARVGAARAPYVNPFGRLLREGILLTGGSDAPGTPHDPWEAIYAAVTRKNLEGKPEGGWYPENCISVYDAVCMYTKNAAYSSYEENIKGTVTVGKLADFIVLDEDVFAMDPMKIKDIQVRSTYLGGKLVYERSGV
ncbi:amidohydrolase [Oscillibacter sp. GMB15532]|uniref:amidohydrolase n=1 Tax=Oscillibacter sp. GMB15532 TaxID=3230022 RepID=UPI0034DE1A4F